MKILVHTIVKPNGIHARPAGMLVQTMRQFRSVVMLVKNGQSADTKKLFQIMRLGVKCNDGITVTAEGDDEDAAIAAMKDFLESNL